MKSPEAGPRFSPEDYELRPRDYDARIASLIIDRIANGEMLPSICQSCTDYPLPSVFLRWCEEYRDLMVRYVDARRLGTEVNLDEMVAAAHLSDPTAARVRSDALLKHVERTLPDRYGPRATIKTATQTEPDAGGVDFAAELRRRFDAIAERQRQERQARGD